MEETASLTFASLIKNYNALVQLVNENFELKELVKQYRELVQQLKEQANEQESNENVELVQEDSEPTTGHKRSVRR